MNKIRVLFISHEGSLGGAARSLIEMLKGFNDRIYARVVLPEPGMLEDELVKIGIEYDIVPFSMGYGIIGHHSIEDENDNFYISYDAAIKIVEIIRKHKIQMIHSNSIVGNVGAIAACMAEVPHIWHIRELLEEDFNSELWDKEFKRRLFKQTQAFITISRCVQNVYFEKYNLLSTCIYDGMDLQKYYESISSAKIERIKAIIVGNITKEKGQLDAVKAIEVLKDRNINVSLVIIGNGNQTYVWSLKKYIHKKGLDNNITVMPFQSDLRKWRSQCNVAITTSQMEALGRGTIEAMLAGNVVIGAQSGGTEELIGNNKLRGFLYKPGEPETLADAMQAVLNTSTEELIKIRMRAQQHIVKCFDAQVYADKIIKIYEKAMDNFQRKKSTNLLSDMQIRYSDRNSEVTQNNDGISNKINQEYRYKNLFEMANKWWHICFAGRKVEEYFIKHDLSRIAIYGMGNLGRNLYDELEKSSIEVLYGIDRADMDYVEFVPIIKPYDTLSEVDAIIVTNATKVEEIVDYLRSKSSCRIIPLKEVLDWFII